MGNIENQDFYTHQHIKRTC